MNNITISLPPKFDQIMQANFIKAGFGKIEITEAQRLAFVCGWIHELIGQYDPHVAVEFKKLNHQEHQQ